MRVARGLGKEEGILFRLTLVARHDFGGPPLRLHSDWRLTVDQTGVKGAGIFLRLVD